MPGTFSIAFTVPSAASVGETPHGYIFGAAYQRNELDYQALRTKWAAPTGAINGVNLIYTLPAGDLPVAEGTLEVYVKGPSPATAWTLQTIGTHYSFNWWTGTITFTTAPAIGSEIRVNYNHYDKLNPYGDGVRDTWYLANDRTPVVPNSWTFYVKDDSTLTVTALASTAYTFDRFWGQIQLTTPLEPWQQLLARYDWYIRFPWYDSSDTGYTFVVISQDQADYHAAWQRYRETYDTEQLNPTYSGSALQQMGQAEQLRAQAEIEYREGKFADAAATMQSAVDTLNAAIASEAALYDTVNTGLTGLLTGAGSVVDGYGAKLNAEAKATTDKSAAEVTKMKAEASKARGYGTFLILMGVFFIIVAVAFLLLAIGKFLLWRSPTHHEQHT
jgi:hypothetical protein